MRAWVPVSDWSLRTRLIGLLFAASFLPLLIVTVNDVRGERATLLGGEGALLSARGDHLADQLDAFHRGYQRSVDQFAHLPEVVSFFRADLDSRTQLARDMRALLHVWPGRDPRLRAVALLDTTGVVAMATDQRLVGVDLSYRSFVQEALRAPDVVTADIYLADRAVDYAPTIAYLAPVRSSGSRTSGLVAFFVHASSLWNVMKASNGLAGPGSFAVLFDRLGIRIGHTYSDEILFHPGGTLDPETKGALIAERRFGERTRELLEDVRPFPEQFERARSSSPDQEVFYGLAPVNGKWNYGVGRRFATVPWTVFYMVPEDSFLAHMTSVVRRKSLLAGFIMLAAIAAGAFFAAGILRPIATLRAATHAIAGGNLAARVPASSNDELGRLGISFNLMAERLEEQALALRAAHGDLETRVAERAKQLALSTKEVIDLKTALDVAAIVAITDPRGRIRYANRRFCDITQYSREELLGQDHRLLNSGLHSKEFIRGLWTTIERGEVWRAEVGNRAKDGSIFWIDMTIVPFLDSNREPQQYVAISADITERKLSDGVVRDAEARYRTLFNTLIEGFCTIEVLFDAAGKPVDYRFLEINPAFERQTGLVNAQGKRMRELAPNHEQHWFDIYGRIALTGEPLQFENEAKALGRHYDVCAYRVGGPESRKVAILFNDVTHRKVAEQKVNDQLAHLHLLNHITRAIGERQDLQSILQVAIRSIEDELRVDFGCVCGFDAAANALTVVRIGVKGAATAAELGLGEHAIIPVDENGLSRCLAGHLIYEPDTAASPVSFPQRLARAGLRSLVMAPLIADGKVFGVLIAARRAPDDFVSGECEFLKQLSENVALASRQAELHRSLQQAYDDLHKTQQAAMQQERLRALGEMASGIAHDINNSISPISIYAESLLEQEPNLSARARSQLTTIKQSVEDVAQTVSRLREFYRRREPQLALAPVRMNALVTQVAHLTRARWRDMPQKGGVVIDLALDLAEDLPSVMGVESEIREALTNLVFNAVDAMAAGGTLTLRTRAIESVAGDAPRKFVEAQVQDTGTGMDEATRRRCLEPFFTTKGERGTGLGLAMVYGTAQRHGAEVGIESAQGEGTTISLRFPVPAGKAAENLHSLPTMRPARGLRILVVDDDPLLIKSLRDALEADGHDVITAPGGQEGIDAFRRSLEDGPTFAAVITDLGMPHVDGRQVAAAIKAASAATPIILLTGWGERLMADGELPAHVDRVLSKPPRLRELRAALAALSDRR